MKYIEFNIYNGQKNMQVDSDLLDFAIRENLQEPIFRLYGWSPACVSLGRNQDDSFLDKEFLKTKKIDVVRRLTGGRALLHDKEITYSYICPVSSLKNGESVTHSYKEISRFLIKGFKNLGVSLDFPENKKPQTKHSNSKIGYCMSLSTGADLSFNNKKLIGSAQFRKEGYILQHGSILIDYDKELIQKLFNEEVSKESLTTIKEILPSSSQEDIIDKLINAFT